ncbi:MAG: hypothetical protein GY953_02865, partial [bacterium]|nr:hypothetical protein [bacterium]
MNEISEAAWEGLQKVPRRGLEVGGVLFGVRSGDELQITNWRPISCEHAKGPGFELSANDEAALKRMLEESAAASELLGLEPLGWFHSHTRDDIFLSDRDVDLYKRFFPAPWQVALVLKPHMQQPTRGGFFFREEDGSLRAASSHLEFTLGRRSRRLPVGFDPSNPQVRTPAGESLPQPGGQSRRVAEPV